MKCPNYCACSGSLCCSHVHLKLITVFIWKEKQMQQTYLSSAPLRWVSQCLIIRKLHTDKARPFEYLILIQLFPSIRPRRRWKDNIKTALRETWWGCMDWIRLVQDKAQQTALVNTVLNPRLPQNVGKFLSSWATGGFSRLTQLHGVSFALILTRHLVG
jgi:hypothetical protein